MEAGDSSGSPARRDGRPLGILAAGGPLPIRLAEAGLCRGRSVHIVAIDGFADEAIARFPHERVNLGQLGRILGSFKQADVGEIVIAGAIQRPNLSALRIDWGFVKNLPTVYALTRGGDDSVLRRVVRFFEGHGFKVVGASDIAPDLLAPIGQLTAGAPSSASKVAITRARALISALGPFDIGQGVVAGADGIVAVESVLGTDAMLRDLGPGGIAQGRGEGGVLVKLAKPGQEMRIDLPTIGPETVRGAAAAGLAGLAIGGGATIVIEREQVIEAADRAGMFVAALEFVSDVTGSDAAADPAAASPVQAPATLQVVARRAPTPGQRRDIGIGRRVLDVLRSHGAGRSVLVAREHVLAVSGVLAPAEFVSSRGRIRTWGGRLLGRRRGVLVIDGARAEDVLDVALFSAAKATDLAGIVMLAPLAEGNRRAEIVAWANEAGVFLMCRAELP
ncbi:MAG: LpxI family protein [Hyphomicrobiaceae bacterium]